MTKKTILVGGYGPGISSAVAERFGRAGYAVALVARNEDKLAAAVTALGKLDIRAKAVVAELGDEKAVRGAVERARELGPIAAIHWNAYAGAAGDLLAADTAAIHQALDVATVGLLAAVQAAHADLRETQGAILVTNGGFGLLDPKADAAAVEYGSMGLALANATKTKLVGLLGKRLEKDGIYVGQVTVLGQIKGTPWDRGQATIEGKTVAEKFWELATTRSTSYASVNG